MGGWGSGEHFRKSDAKYEVEQVPCLCTETWKRWGLLGPDLDKAGVWEWSTYHDYEPIRQRIGYRIETAADAGHLHLAYTYADIPVKYTIKLVTRPCNFGGVRWGFGCPLVGHDGPRCSAKLYRVGRYFGCRDCHRLAYRSQNNFHKGNRLSRLFRFDARYDRREQDWEDGRWQGCWVGGPLLPDSYRDVGPYDPNAKRHEPNNK